MFRFNHILVPADFSKEFENALNYTKEMASSIGSTLHIVHALEPTIAPTGMTLSPHAKIVDVENEIRKHAEKNIEEIKERLMKENYPVKTHIEPGPAADVILDYARENEIDVICISTKGKSGLEHLLFGSTTEKVLRLAECPVIAIKMPKEK